MSHLTYLVLGWGYLLKYSCKHKLEEGNYCSISTQLLANRLKSKLIKISHCNDALSFQSWEGIYLCHSRKENVILMQACCWRREMEKSLGKLSGIFSIPDFLFVASQKANVFESGNVKEPCTAIVCQSWQNIHFIKSIFSKREWEREREGGYQPLWMVDSWIKNAKYADVVSVSNQIWCWERKIPQWKGARMHLNFF